MEQTTTTAVTAKRPTFVTVLCILSWAGIALSLYSSFNNYADFKAIADGNTASVLQGIEGMEGGKEMAAVAEAGMDMLGINPSKISTGFLIVGLLNLLVLGGVLMMWKLKKMGFYVYTIGQLAQVGVMFGVIGGLVGGVMGIVMAVFSVLFIILYAVNLKHMS